MFACTANHVLRSVTGGMSVGLCGVTPLTVQVGVPLLLTKPDLQRIAPLWLHYSRQVRLDPEVCALSEPSTSMHSPSHRMHADPLYPDVWSGSWHPWGL